MEKSTAPVTNGRSPHCYVTRPSHLICRFSSDGSITYANEAFYRCFRKNPSESAGNISTLIPEPTLEEVRSWLELLSPDNPALTREYSLPGPGGKTCRYRWTSMVIFAPDPHTVEYQLVGQRLPDPEWKEGRLSNIQNEPLELVREHDARLVRILEALCKEVDRRRNAEKVLQENEYRMRLITNNMLDVVNQLDLNGILQYASPSNSRVLGYQPGEMLGKSVLSFIHPDDSETFMSGFRAVIQDRTPVSVEVRYRRADGSYIWMECYGNCLVEPNGEVSGAVISSQDITESKRILAELEKSLEMSRLTLEGTAQALAATSEKRDPYTAGHQRRVTQLACEIGKQLGLTGEPLQALRIASMLHDIGKIYVPAEILSKPGRLLYGEMLLIKSHPQVGSDIVKMIPFPRAVPTIILQHHERLDGSGYPYCLSGEDILFESRILAVADVVEAMASHRPYRPAYKLGDALEEITLNRASLYDPEVVDACLKLFTIQGFQFE